MKKKMLENHTSRYERLPAWLMILLACLMVVSFFYIGSIVYAMSLGILLVIFLVTSGLAASIDMSNLSTDINSFPYLLQIELLSCGVIMLIIFAWVKWYEKRLIRTLGFFREKWFGELIKGFGVGLMIFSCAFFLTYLFGGVSLQSVDFSTSTILYVLLTIPFWILQGGTEELLTRGWLLPIIYKRSNLAVAVAISSTLFGFMHLGNNYVSFCSILSIILSGFFMALYMLKTDNLWGVAGLHGAWNFTQGNVYGVAVSGQSAGSSLFHFANNASAADWISGGSFGTEGSLLTSLVLLVGIAYLAWQLKRETIN